MVLRNTTVLLLVMTTITIALGATYFKFTKMYCYTNPQFFYNHTCHLKALNRYKSVAMMETWIIDKLSNVTVNFAMFVRNSANAYKPFVVNGTVNICQLLKSRGQGPYGTLIRNVFSQFSNVNHSCPYEGLVMLKNGYMNASHYPVTFPENSYKTVFTFYENYPDYNLGHADFYVDYLEDKKKFN